MTNDENYSGFLAIDSLWAWAILLKHVAYGGMVALTAYLQFFLYPAMGRLGAAGAKSRPETAAVERDKMARREMGYLAAEPGGRGYAGAIPLHGHRHSRLMWHRILILYLRSHLIAPAHRIRILCHAKAVFHRKFLRKRTGTRLSLGK
jgi:hypothetical protein